jgi:hypothetical protein
MDKSWRYWLREVAKYYKVTQKEVLLPSKINIRAKSTLYWILFKEGIDLYTASVQMGKNRTTIIKFIKNSGVKEFNKYRDKSAEDYLIYKSRK